MFKAAGRMTRLILQVQRDTGRFRQREPYEVRVRRAIDVSLNAIDRPREPITAIRFGPQCLGQATRQASRFPQLLFGALS